MSSRPELEKMTATKLREVAREYTEITGASGMKKEELVEAVLKARGEPVKEIVKDAEKMTALKKRIRTIKADKKKSLDEKDGQKAAELRKQLKKLKRQTRLLAGDKKSTSKKDKE